MATEFSIRRRIAAELAGIQQQLQQCSLNDTLTGSIRTWHRDFHTEFKGSDRDQETLNIYLGRMKSLMRGLEGDTPLDPRRVLSQAPIDEGAVLGRDGNTYGEKALKVYLSALRGPDRFKFPYQPDNATVFTVVPHPLARHMADWLERHGQVDQEVLELQEELPTERSYRVFQYAERMTKQREEMETAAKAQMEQFRRENIAAARAEFAPLEEQMDQNEAARTARVQELRQEHVQFHQEHTAQVHALQDRLGALNSGTLELDEQIGNTEVATDNLGKSQARLQTAIQAAAQPQPKRKTHWEKVAASIVVAIVFNVNITF